MTDVTIGDLKRLSYLPDRKPAEKQGELIAGQVFAGTVLLTVST